MNMQTTAQQLRAGLRPFQGIIERYVTAPVLSTVKLSGGRLIGSNLDMDLSVALPTVGAMAGEIAVDYRMLRSLAATIDGDEVLTVSAAGNVASVAFNGSDYRMASISAADFPAGLEVEGEQTEAGNLGLLAAIRRVMFAMSREETRYYLNGVAIVADPDGGAVVVATDGHRLGIHPLAAAPSGAVGTILPAAAVSWLIRQGCEPDAVTFDAERKRVRFDLPGMMLSARLIDGTYPDVFRVIPKDAAPVFSVERAVLLRALRRIRAFASAPFAPVKLSAAGDSLTITMSDPCDKGCSAREVLPLAGGGASAAFEAGYNVGYLCAALGALRGERVTVSAVGGQHSEAPTAITADDDSLRVVQMPMRV